MKRLLYILIFLMISCSNDECDCVKITYNDYSYEHIKGEIVITTFDPIEVSREYVVCQDERTEVLKEGYFYVIECN